MAAADWIIRRRQKRHARAAAECEGNADGVIRDIEATQGRSKYDVMDPGRRTDKIMDKEGKERMLITYKEFKIEGTPEEVRELLQLSSNVEKPKAKPESVKAKPKAKPIQKKLVDVGKIRALRNGNWTMEAIADEMKLSIPTIRKYLKECAS